MQISAAALQPMIQRPVPDAATAGGSNAPVILVVDDDAGIRRLVAAVLRRMTLAQVIEAGDPYTALRIAMTDARKIDVLISDIGLRSAINGIELAGNIAALFPMARVLLISADESSGSGVRPEWRFLAKPFPVSVLMDCVTGLLPHSSA